MGRLVAVAAALTTGLALFFAYSAPTSASPGAEVLKACAPDQAKIQASRLPAVVSLGRCPVGERTIVDNGVESTLPKRGESVHAESLNISGAQELLITHRPDGSVELGEVGDDSAGTEQGAAVSRTAASSSPAECSDGAYTDFGYRLSTTLRFYFNRANIPSGLTPSAAEAAINRAGANVASTRNACGLGDRVPVGLSYAGATGYAANVTSSGGCATNDGRSVVSFGSLAQGTLAVACTYYVPRNGRNEAVASDVRVSTLPAWTVNPTAPSCRGRYDLESVMTHERGHTFGLNHVSESYHGNLTMSTNINGPCQASERTLGRGDVIGLDVKYP